MVAEGSARVLPLKKQSHWDTVARAATPSDVLQAQPIAMRPLVGG